MGFLTLKLMGIVARQMRFLSIWDVFGRGVLACKLIGDSKETLHNKCDETMARLQKIKDADYQVVSMWWCSLENICVTFLALKMNSVHSSM
jgi:hypothetical protein